MTRLDRLRLLALMLLGFFLLNSLQTASAADGTVVSSQDNLLFVVNMAVAVLLPLLTQAITNSSASAQYKAILNLLVAAVIGALTPFLTGAQAIGSANWTAVAVSALSVWLVSIVSHYGLWKPTNVTGVGGSIDTKVPGGLGAAPIEPAPAGADVSHGDVANPVLTVQVPPSPTVAPDPVVAATADTSMQGSDGTIATNIDDAPVLPADPAVAPVIQDSGGAAPVPPVA